MKITTIIVTKDDDERLSHTLLSIFSQKCKTQLWEILVFDGNSSCKTQELVKKLSRSDLKYTYIQGEDSGIYDAMNQAVESSSGEYIHFLNCGDTFYEVESFRKVLDLVKTCHSFYTWNVFDEERQKALELERLNLWSAITGISSYCHQGQLISKRMFMENGKLNDTLKVCADYELTLKLLTVSLPINFPQILINYQGKGFSRTSPSLLLNEKRQALNNWRTWRSTQEHKVGRFIGFYVLLMNSFSTTFKLQRKIASFYD
jgi:glycosyltransferase involved in cell wall biosynthesis